ncbi:putative peptidase [Pseudomonas aeruginosa]|nr:putative peptidase [Pseudomonas aeruginosa]
MVDYGDWPSDWSAERAVAAGRDFSELKAAHGGLAWVEFDPASARSRLYLWRDGVLEEPTAPDGSVRSRVYEYGGGACCVTLDGLAWVDETDQQVRRWRAGRAAQVLGGGAQCRYGDLAYVDAWDALLAVEESHGPTGVVHRIVRLDADGARRVLVEGADFYAAPRAAGQGRRLAWIEWDRPHQPWTETRLGLAENGRTPLPGRSRRRRVDPATTLRSRRPPSLAERPRRLVASLRRGSVGRPLRRCRPRWRALAIGRLQLPAAGRGKAAAQSRRGRRRATVPARSGRQRAAPGRGLEPVRRTGRGCPGVLLHRGGGRAPAGAAGDPSRRAACRGAAWRRATAGGGRPVASAGLRLWAGQRRKRPTVSSIRRAMPAAASIPDDHRRCWCGCMADRPRCIRRRSMPACSSGPSAVSPWPR